MVRQERLYYLNVSSKGRRGNRGAIIKPIMLRRRAYILIRQGIMVSLLFCVDLGDFFPLFMPKGTNFVVGGITLK
ncbi:TPA: hypothetical protein HA281_02070 [Candidatus Woesearchaeota archaeon]|nr:hypothetical protein [Candidatus Woesearchaeota archaeon]HIH91566.1 hypothetical protein [Candidatus Woesearchaeota archaeon]